MKSVKINLICILLFSCQVINPNQPKSTVLESTVSENPPKKTVDLTGVDLGFQNGMTETFDSEFKAFFQQTLIAAEERFNKEKATLEPELFKEFESLFKFIHSITHPNDISRLDFVGYSKFGLENPTEIYAANLFCIQDIGKRFIALLQRAGYEDLKGEFAHNRESFSQYLGSRHEKYLDKLRAQGELKEFRLWVEATDTYYITKP